MRDVVLMILGAVFGTLFGQPVLELLYWWRVDRRIRKVEAQEVHLTAKSVEQFIDPYEI